MLRSEPNRKQAFYDTRQSLSVQSDVAAASEEAALLKVALPHAAWQSACGKAIIVGEHAVVYGARAVAMPLPNVRISVALQPQHDFRADLGRRDGQAGVAVRVTLDGKTVSKQIYGVVTDALQALEIEACPMHIEGHSSLPIGAGLGSSAALCVALLRVLADAYDKTVSLGELAQLANQMETRFHGKPSGLDTAVVAYERIISYARGQAPQPVSIRNQGEASWRFALLDSGVRSSTLATIQQASPYFTGRHADGRIARFDELAGMVLSGFEKNQRGLVAEAMNEAARLLDAAGVVNDDLRRIEGDALRLGVAAAKPTGAGGGGAVLALLRDEDAEGQIARLQGLMGRENVYEVTLL